MPAPNEGTPSTAAPNEGTPSMAIAALGSAPKAANYETEKDMCMALLIAMPRNAGWPRGPPLPKQQQQW